LLILSCLLTTVRYILGHACTRNEILARDVMTPLAQAAQQFQRERISSDYRFVFNGAYRKAAGRQDWASARTQTFSAPG
jgi:hypothetical protein